MRRRHKCIVCGRVFPEGQGIVINYGGVELSFHSSRCAAKFLRQLLDRVPPDVLGGYVKRLVEENLEKLREAEKLKAKRI